MSRFFGLTFICALGGCASSYHPEYHPVTSTTLKQTVNYGTLVEPGGTLVVTTGTARPPASAAPPASTATAPQRVQPAIASAPKILPVVRYSAVNAPVATTAPLPPQTPAVVPQDGEAICRNGSVADCAAACEANDAKACWSLANLYKQGHRVALDARRARALGEHACDLHLLVACDALTASWGWCWVEPAPHRHPREFAYATCPDAYHQECALEDDYKNPRCWTLAQLAPPKERDYALGRIRETCALEKDPADGGACWNLVRFKDTSAVERRFALDRICHSSHPVDTCGMLKDMDMPDHKS